MGERPLTPKQQRFIDEYLIDLNATDAYRRAGYAARTDTVARVGGSRLLAKPNIAVAVAEAQQQRAERVELTQDWVLARLRHESQLTGKDASHSARVAALKLIGLHLGMFPRKHVVQGPKGESPFPPWEDLVRLPREDLLRLYEERRRLAEGKPRE
jgi:phage terminase small subunit